MSDSGIEQGSDRNTVHVLANYATRSVVPNGSYCTWTMPIDLNFKSQLLLRTEKFSNAENNESFIYMLFKLYVQV